MGVAKRSGPDFLFLSNANSQKFKDIEANKEVNLSFEDSSKHDWISVTGEAVTASNDDPRIKEIWSKPIAIWFGDVGDGVHNGSPEDPRMKLIEVQPKCMSGMAVLCMRLLTIIRHHLLQAYDWHAGFRKGGRWVADNRRCREYWRSARDARG